MCFQKGNIVERLRTIEEEADYLQIPAGTLRQWRHKGFGPPAIKVGRHVRYRPADTERWLTELNPGLK